MRKYGFTSGGMSFSRVSRPSAFRAYTEGRTVALLPSRANPYSPWIRPFCFNRDQLNDSGGSGSAALFERAVNAYEYYNCPSELGRTAVFFVAS